MTYANDQSRAKMVSVVVNMYKDQLTDEFRRTNYISMMADCKTDTGGLKNETMYAHFIREGRPVNRLVAQKAREEYELIFYLQEALTMLRNSPHKSKIQMRSH